MVGTVPLECETQRRRQLYHRPRSIASWQQPSRCRSGQSHLVSRSIPLVHENSTDAADSQLMCCWPTKPSGIRWFARPIFKAIIQIMGAGGSRGGVGWGGWGLLAFGGRGDQHWWAGGNMSFCCPAILADNLADKRKAKSVDYSARGWDLRSPYSFPLLRR